MTKTEAAHPVCVAGGCIGGGIGNRVRGCGHTALVNRPITQHEIKACQPGCRRNRRHTDRGTGRLTARRTGHGRGRKGICARRRQRHVDGHRTCRAAIHHTIGKRNACRAAGCRDGSGITGGRRKTVCHNGLRRSRRQSHRKGRIREGPAKGVVDREGQRRTAASADSGWGRLKRKRGGHLRLRLLTYPGKHQNHQNCRENRFEMRHGPPRRVIYRRRALRTGPTGRRYTKKTKARSNAVLCA
mmetsp:Transcript_28765/g.54548  ORF Transcript_28765/g.54548 Transcript_28765/m.54548 type:complete len:243 (+) Transcript_28765:8328-9056(+)